MTMAYAPMRPMNAELRLGMVEGGVKLVNKNRGGFCEETTYRRRENLPDVWYGIHEAAAKTTPDVARRVTTPCYVYTPPADPSAI